MRPLDYAIQNGQLEVVKYLEGVDSYKRYSFISFGILCGLLIVILEIIGILFLANIIVADNIVRLSVGIMLMFMGCVGSGIAYYAAKKYFSRFCA